MSGEDKIETLRQRRKEARQSGGPEEVAARRRAGVGSARERIEHLLDPDTFVELDVFVEGAVTGHGMIAGRSVYVFSQQAESPTDPDAEGLARKLNKLADLALANGAPLVGIYDSGKLEATSLQASFMELAQRSVQASGVIPQIAAVVGPVGGAEAYVPALADVLIVVKGNGQLFVGDPASVKDSGIESVAGARVLSERSGVAHLAADDESESLGMVRALLSYLPQNNLEDTPISDEIDPVDRMDAELDAMAKAEPRPDVREVIEKVLDKDSFMELSPSWGSGVVVGLARLGGRAIGLVANQPSVDEGRLDPDSACKAARFVRLCDAFNLPLVTFVETAGLAGGEGQEHGRLVREAAKLMYAYAEATVPKLSVVTGSACGEGLEVMCPKLLKADLCFGWPTARIGISGGNVADADDTEAPYRSAKAGYLDDVIEPVTTRPRLVVALEACASKRESRPSKKHGNIPL